MKKLFSFLKNKKTLFALIFLTATIITIPKIVHAQSDLAAQFVLSGVGDALFNSIMMAFMSSYLYATAVASDLARILLTWVMNLSTGGIISYTKSDAVIIGWPIVRDLANMIIVLGFVVIGIATSLRIENYKAGKLLAPLIVVALLVNFSLVICGIFIDGSNIVMNSFFSKTGDVSSYFNNTVQSFNMLGKTLDSPWYIFGSEMLAMTFFNFLSFFIFLLYAVLLLARIIALWLLVILSPLAFVCYVFPATKTVWQKWSSNFLQWCIVGIPMGLFFYIGSQMINTMSSHPELIPTVGVDTVFSTAEVVKAIASSVSLIVPGFFLIIGFMASLQFSAMGVSSIMNFANKNKGKILGGGLSSLNKLQSATTGKLAGAAGQGISNYGASLQARGKASGGFGGTLKSAAGWSINKVGNGAQRMQDLRASSQKTSSAIGRGLEKVGAVRAGTQASADQSDIESMAKTYTAAYESNNPADKVRVVNMAHNGSGKDRSAAIQAIAGKGRLHKEFTDIAGNTDLNAINEALTYGESFGASKNIRKNATKEIPAMKQFDPELMKKLTDPVVSGGKGYSPVDAIEAATVEGFGELSVDETRKLSPKNMTAHILTGNVDKTLKAAELMSDEQRNKLREMCTTGTTAYSDAITLSGQLAAMGMNEESDRILDHITDGRMQVL